ncbi:MAG: glycoside hydrolase family 3 C-terminal domain-containing protein [Candidatus Coproplasma sp.]
MLKYRDIIEKLTTEQKLSLIASLDSLGGSAFEGTGIPCVKIGRMNDINAGAGYEYPSFQALANSWNAGLMGEVSGKLAARARSAGANLAFTPDLRLRSTPYQYGMTEDPLLAEIYAKAIASAAGKNGVLPCLSECGLNEVDAYYADKEVNRRALREYFLRPFSSFVSGENRAVSLSYATLSGKYRDINTENIGSFLKKSSPEGFIVSVGTDAASQVKSLAAGNILSDGDVGVIRAARDNYLNLKDKVNKGEWDAEELEKTCLQGRAISDAVIDQAADRVIEFAFACKRASESAKKSAPEAKKELSVKAAEESIVLLKNSANVLPLRKGTKIAVIGKIPTALGDFTHSAFAKAAAESGKCTVTGTCEGYEIGSDRSDELIAEACKCAAGADVTVLFLGTDAEREKAMTNGRKLSLPANQLALLSALCENRIKVIAVIDSGLCIDTSFDVKVPAVLVAPMDGAHCAKALVSVLTGAVSPSGRLAATYYDFTDEIYASAYANKQSEKSKVGVFIGYRNYDTAGCNVRYPFGYGLSYTEFRYSSLSVKENKVSFTVKNVGRRAGSEVAQVYLGKEDSSVVCPKKQLAAYTKIALKAGESRQVTLTLDSSAVSVNTNIGRVTEAGEYTVYVGSSVSDVRLTGKATLAGKKLKQSNENVSDYLQTFSNVLTDGYVFGDIKPVPKKGKKLKITGLTLVIISVLTAAAILALSALGIISFLPQLQILVAAMIPVAVLGVLLFVIGLAIGIRAKRKASVIPEKEAERIAATKKQTAKNMFEELFDDYSDSDDGSEEEQDDSVASDIFGISTVSCTATCQALDLFAAKRGINLGRKNSSKILAAFCSSRLIIVNGKTGAVPRLLEVLGEFFGSGYYADRYTGYASVEDMLGGGSGGTWYQSEVSRAITAASQHVDSVVMAVLEGVAPEDISGFFMPFTRYVNFPYSTNSAIQLNGSQIKVSPNLWFVFVLKDGARVSATDPYIANLAAYIDLDFTVSKKVGAAEEAEPFTFGKLTGLEFNARDSYSLDEFACWKKIDKVEKYIANNGAFKIDNKGWSRIERFASVYLGCGCEQAEALDCTVAAKLIVPAVAVAAKNPGREQSVGGMLDSVFGEENVPECKKIVSTAEYATSR